MKFSTSLFAFIFSLLLLASCDENNSHHKSPTRTSSVDDKLAPVIRLNGSKHITLLKGAIYIEKKASAKDARDGYVKVTINGAVDTQKVGKYQIEYFAKDSSGNSATAIRYVKIIATLPPLIVLNGKSEVFIGKDTVYREVGITETDDVVGDLILAIQNNVDSSQLGDYSVVYLAKDKRSSTKLKRVVHVIDNRPPTLTLIGDRILRMAYDSYYKEKGATAVDDVDGKVSVVIEGKVNNKKIGFYKIIYTAKDKAGNVAKIVREVEVVDITPPTITLLGEKKVLLRVGDVYHEARATAMDKVDGEIEVFRIGSVDTSKVGVYTFVYSAKDKARNEASVSREVKVVALPKTVLSAINETNSTVLDK